MKEKKEKNDAVFPPKGGHMALVLVLPTTPLLKLFGWGNRVSPAGLHAY